MYKNFHISIPKIITLILLKNDMKNLIPRAARVIPTIPASAKIITEDLIMNRIYSHKH